MEDPWTVLQIPEGADDETVRAAYLRKVKQFPPDRAPAAFERIRDAWDTLRDPARRAARILEADPDEPLAALAADLPIERRFVGPDPWLEAMREVGAWK